MIKMAASCSVAGTAITPKTLPPRHHGLAVSRSWSSFGKRRMLSSLLSAGCFQDLSLHVRIKKGHVSS